MSGVRRHRCVLLLAAIAALSASCTGAGNGQDDGQVTLRFTLAASPEELPGYEALVTAFEDSSDVDVQLSPVASRDELLARLTTELSGGAAPDVFLLNFRSYGRFAAEGALEPIQPYLDASDAIAPEDFAQVAFDAFRYDGEDLSCMPQNASSLVVYYNADLFAAAGLQPPTAGWTWDEFVADAIALTDGDTYGVGIEPELIKLAPFVWQAGGEVTDDPVDPSQLTLDSPAARAALDWFLDLSLEHHVVPPAEQEEAMDRETRFLQGQLGMYLSSRVAVPTLRTIEDFEWDAAPLPAMEEGSEPTSILHADAYCMSATGSHHDQAWSFIEFAMGQEGQTILAESGRTVPSRLDVAGSPAFLEPSQPPSNSRVFIDNLQHLRTTPHVAAWAEVEKVGDQILSDLFYGRADRDTGLQQLLDVGARLLGAGG